MCRDTLAEVPWWIWRYSTKWFCALCITRAYTLGLEPTPLSDLGCHPPPPFPLPSNNLRCHPLSLNDFQCHPSFLPHPTPLPLITLDAIHYPKWLWMPYIFAINHTSLTYFLYHPSLPHFPLYALWHHSSLPSPQLPPTRLWVPTTEQYLNVTVHITFGLYSAELQRHV